MVRTTWAMAPVYVLGMGVGTIPTIPIITQVLGIVLRILHRPGGPRGLRGGVARVGILGVLRAAGNTPMELGMPRRLALKIVVGHIWRMAGTAAVMRLMMTMFLFIEALL